MTEAGHGAGAFGRLARRFMPGLEALSRYDRSWLSSDVAAGVSVAAIALPVGIAMQLPPVWGLSIAGIAVAGFKLRSIFRRS